MIALYKAEEKKKSQADHSYNYHGKPCTIFTPPCCDFFRSYTTTTAMLIFLEVTGKNDRRCRDLRKGLWKDDQRLYFLLVQSSCSSGISRKGALGFLTIISKEVADTIWCLLFSGNHFHQIRLWSWFAGLPTIRLRGSNISSAFIKLSAPTMDSSPSTTGPWSRHSYPRGSFFQFQRRVSPRHDQYGPLLSIPR